MSENAEEQMIPLSPERLLAALLKTSGPTAIPVDILLGDYSNYQIAVDQEQDGMVTFELVEAEDDES